MYIVYSRMSYSLRYQFGGFNSRDPDTNNKF